MVRLVLAALLLSIGVARADMFNSTAGGAERLPARAVAALPACNAANTGLIHLVTDALSPTTRVAVVGGGAVIIPVVCNGTNWIVIG
jgi:hypothetical protein